MTDNVLDAILELDRNGAVLRTIDISPLKNPAETRADAEGITWLYGEKYAVVMEASEEMAVFTIAATTTEVSRGQAAIYDLFGDPKGVAYSASEDAIYWVSQTAPMRVVKSRLNADKNTLDVVWNKVVDNLPDAGLADIAFFPRLSPHPFLLGQSSHTIMEVDLSGNTAVLKSSFSLSAWPIPRPGALAFDADGTFRVIGKHMANAPEDDFNVFAPTAPIPNLSPRADAGPNIETVDFTGRGAVLAVDGSASVDPDGAIVRYEWMVDGTVAVAGYGPRVAPLSHSFLPGLTTVKLIVMDDARSTDEAAMQVQVRRFSGAPEDHPTSAFPQPASYPTVSLNYIHSGALIQRAEFFYELHETGFAEIHVYDQQGRQVVAFKTPTTAPGQYRAPWDLRNGSGEPVASGAYFVVIKTPGNVKKDSVVVVR